MNFDLFRAYPPDEPAGGNDSGGNFTDGCECNDTALQQGVPITAGTPTICCTSHRQWRIHLGDDLGEHFLYHAGGDVWSTFSADAGEDNPVVINCYPDSDSYDVVMDIAAGTITLEARAALNCDAVCFEYKRLGEFGCQKANQFNLNTFDGWKTLPLCLCVSPVTDNVTDEDNCMPGCFSAVPPLVIATIPTGATCNAAVWSGSGCCACTDIGGIHELTYSAVTNDYEKRVALANAATCCGDPGCTEREIIYRLTCDNAGPAGALKLQVLLECPEVGCDEQFLSCLAEWRGTGQQSGESCGNYTLSNTDTDCTPVIASAQTPACNNLPATVAITSSLVRPTESGHCTAC